MQDFFNWQGVIGTIVGIVGTLFALFAWRKSNEVERFLEQEKVRLNEKVGLILTDGKTEKQLPSLRRQEVTRMEIQGRLGTIPMKKKGDRYSIKYTHSPDFYEKIYRIIEGSNENGDTALVINCTNEEFVQFDFDSDPVQTATENQPANGKKLAVEKSGTEK